MRAFNQSLSENDKVKIHIKQLPKVFSIMYPRSSKYRYSIVLSRDTVLPFKNVLKFKIANIKLELIIAAVLIQYNLKTIIIAII